MDPGTLALLIPVLALATGLVTAIKRPARPSRRHRDEEPDDAGRRALEEEVDALRLQLADQQTRLDFVERLLAQPKDAARLPESGAPARGDATPV